MSTDELFEFYCKAHSISYMDNGKQKTYGHRFYNSIPAEKMETYLEQMIAKYEQEGNTQRLNVCKDIKMKIQRYERAI